MTRVRVPEVPGVGDAVALDAEQAHHLSVVLRARQGDPVELVDGAGTRWEARVATTSPVTVTVLAKVTGPSADPIGHLEVWVPLLKGGKTDDLVRQLTELGATTLVAFTATRSVARLEPAKVARRVARWETIAAEATRQCGRASVPSVRFSTTLPTTGPGVYLWEEGGATAQSALVHAVAGDTLKVLTGPEGGLDPADAAALDAAGWQPASLGARVLRAETAAVAAATLALAALGESGYG